MRLLIKGENSAWRVNSDLNRLRARTSLKVIIEIVSFSTRVFFLSGIDQFVMGEETSDAVNLDLNLDPGPEGVSGSVPSEVENLDEWFSDPIERIPETVRIRTPQRWRWRQVQIPRQTQTLSVVLNELMGNSGNVSTLQAGEGSVTAEERTNEVPKLCENNNGFLEDEVSDKKSDIDKGSSSEGSFFDCNICLDLATNPVVTCCGHLFCWPCLHQWLNVYSDAKECPVCKGEVTTKNVTPIYGRGSNIREPEDSNLEIPVRPQARRVESLRQTIQRNPFTLPVEEMIRRLGSRFDLARDWTPSQDSNASRETTDRTQTYLNRIMTRRGSRAEQHPIAGADNIVDLTQSSTIGPEAVHARRFHSLLLRRSQSHSQRSATHVSLASAMTSDETLVDAYFPNHPTGRNQEQLQPVDDRDSFSSIAAGINSESQMDSAVEIDSLVSLSTSSSRRRNDGPRISDVDSGDSRTPRRRRLN